jgi:L-cystine transport system ATP-binding protein
MIAIRNLRKKFDQHEIIKDVSLSINKGEVICVIGPSGSGKTTFLRCLNALEKADSGSIQIEDLDVDFAKAGKKNIHALRSKTAMVFQSYNLFNNKTASENITEGLIYAKKHTKSEAQKISDYYLQKVGLQDRKDFYPYSLSGGQKQRVGIARALALKPDVLLLDEPTSALDPEIVGDVLRLIKRIADEGQTMIIVTHEMRFAEQVASRVVFMEDGKIVEQGPPQEIFSAPKQARTQQFFNSIAYTI